MSNWQRSKDGQKGRNKPKPIKRPGMKSAPGQVRYGGRDRGSKKRTPEEVRALLRARGPQRDEQEVTSDG